MLQTTVQMRSLGKPRSKASCNNDGVACIASSRRLQAVEEMELELQEGGWGVSVTLVSSLGICDFNMMMGIKEHRGTRFFG